MLEPSDALWDWLFPTPTIDDSLVNTDLYINCGSPYAITDDNGQEWSRDIYAKNGWKSNLFDFIFAPNGDAGLYDTYRYSFTLFGPLRYEIPVAPNRQYAVSLYFTQRLEDDSIRQGTTNNPFILDASINTVNMNDMVIISDWTAPRNAIQRTAMITTNDNDDSISISISSTSQGSIEFLFRLFEWSGLPRNPYLNAIEIHDVSTVSPAPTLSPAPTVVEAQGVWIETDSDANLTGRQEACFVFVAATNRAYLIGGQNGNKPVDIYNPVSQTWSQGSMPPIELNHMQCVEFDDKVYILSAWVPREGTGDNNSALIYIYDPLLDAWSTQPGLPEARQRGSSATIVDKTNRRLYLSHGKRFGHGNAQDSNASPSLNWLDCYDVDTATWTALPNAPHVRDHTGGGMVNGKVCVAGGRDSGAIDVVYKKVLPTDCYDPESNTWSEAPPIPTGRSGSAYGMSVCVLLYCILLVLLCLLYWIGFFVFVLVPQLIRPCTLYHFSLSTVFFFFFSLLYGYETVRQPTPCCGRYVCAGANFVGPIFVSQFFSHRQTIFSNVLCSFFAKLLQRYQGKDLDKRGTRSSCLTAPSGPPWIAWSWRVTGWDWP